MNFVKFAINVVVAVVLVANGAINVEAVESADTSSLKPVWRAEVMGSQSDTLPLVKLVPGGQAQSIKLTGINNAQYFDFGVRADELVSDARLVINFTASPALIPTQSQFNVFLNGQLQQSVPVTKESLGKSTRVDVVLDPKLIRSANQLSLEFIGRYQAICEIPTNDALWLTVDASSSLSLTKQKIRLANDLSILPSPFIDTVTGNATVLPFVFATSPNDTEKTAAAILASMGGKVAAWRGIDFPVYYNQLPADSHFVVFMTNERRPDFLKDSPLVEGPQIFITDAPSSRFAKMLVVAGRDERDLLVATKSLASAGHVLIGDRLKVNDFKEPAVREPYDAPHWIDNTNPVAFSTLMQYPGQLTSRGYSLMPVHLSMRLAPDLFMVDSGALSLHLKYRYTKPIAGDSAQLRVRLNGFLVDSVNLVGDESKGTKTINLPALNGALSEASATSLALASQNDLSFEVGYALALSGGTTENCKSVTLLSNQMEIEPTSSISLKGSYHYARLPELRLFTQSGFPFSKYADLSQTVVLIAREAPPTELTTLLNSVARISAATGLAAVKLMVTSEINRKALTDKDLLVISDFPIGLTDLKAENALALQTGVHKQLTKGFLNAGLGENQNEENTEDGVGAIVSLQSPFNSERTVVALLSEGERGSFLLNTQLKNPAALANAKGSVSIINDNETLSFSVGKTYYVGNLPWYHRVWLTVSNYPLLLVGCAILCAILIGGGILYFMRLWVRRRS